MTPTGSASFRDPENAAFLHEGTWYRIAVLSSADALRAHGIAADEQFWAKAKAAFSDAEIVALPGVVVPSPTLMPSARPWNKPSHTILNCVKGMRT